MWVFMHEYGCICIKAHLEEVLVLIFHLAGSRVSCLLLCTLGGLPCELPGNLSTSHYTIVVLGLCYHVYRVMGF